MTPPMGRTETVRFSRSLARIADTLRVDDCRVGVVGGVDQTRLAITAIISELETVGGASRVSSWRQDLRELRLDNGSFVKGYSSERSLRGPLFDACWVLSGVTDLSIWGNVLLATGRNVDGLGYVVAN